MARHLSRVILAAVCAGAVGTASADEGFRCGSKLIELGMTRSQVLQYCGAPAAESEEVQDVRSGGRVVGKTTVYRWTYSSYSSIRVLVFDQDKLTAIKN